VIESIGEGERAAYGSGFDFATGMADKSKKGGGGAGGEGDQPWIDLVLNKLLFELKNKYPARITCKNTPDAPFLPLEILMCGPGQPRN